MFAFALREVGRHEAAMAERRAAGGAMPEKTWTGIRRGRTMSSGYELLAIVGLVLCCGRFEDRAVLKTSVEGNTISGPSRLAAKSNMVVQRRCKVK